MRLDASTTVLITGANGGLGAAMARAVHGQGAKLVVTGRRADALAPLAEELGARIVVADLADRASVDRMHAEVGPVDVAVLNAGISGTGKIHEISPDAIERVLDVNLRVPMLSAQYFAKQMVERKRGHIVFISSIAGKVAAAGSGLYCATKFGLRGFAFGLRGDLAEHGVGVTTMFPGFIRDAGLFAKAGVKLPKGFGTRSPEDCAQALLYSIAHNPAEIDVAAFEQRLGGMLFPVFPEFVSWLQRKGGGKKLAAEMYEARKAQAGRTD